ncbi:hypothetical protein Kpho02_42540 [Kitasatospora phosalacinea]|uniref:Uncharacterized protein n=1 Tax=Kitasatospora phosalacinea TaxID=2065 RepID=A0A9W6Q7X5_9ACTN|nr:hypothetical protein Kpho02_42540 [Kitasatospora phosalacinea]
MEGGGLLPGALARGGVPLGGAELLFGHGAGRHWRHLFFPWVWLDENADGDACGCGAVAWGGDGAQRVRGVW